MDHGCTAALHCTAVHPTVPRPITQVTPEELVKYKSMTVEELRGHWRVRESVKV